MAKTQNSPSTKDGKDGALDGWSADPRKLLRAKAIVPIAKFERDSTPGWTSGKEAALKQTAKRGEIMAELQERLWAQANTGQSQDSLLVLVQGLDTAGKGGIARHVLAMVDPQGVAITAFKKPTPVEAKHDFLWRIEKALPKPGYIGFFDRSHYEDVLVPYVANKLKGENLTKRLEKINRWEAQLKKKHITLVKFALLVSYDEQGQRLLERVDRPDKQWKYSPGDIDTRSDWFKFQSAYEEILEHTDTDVAPWYVIPADHKWYSRHAIAEIILRTLADMNPTWPKPTYDVAAERQRVLATMPEETLSDYEEEKAKKTPQRAGEAADLKAQVAKLNPDADAATVARKFEGKNATGAAYDFGAQVTSWKVGKDEALWASSKKPVAGEAVRGGIPICLPWFGSGKDGNLTPKHGLARSQSWEFVEQNNEGGRVVAKWHLAKGSLKGQRAGWENLSATFEASFGNKLRLELSITNEGKKPVEFEDALHAYLLVSDVEKIQITGLEKVKYLDKVPGQEATRSAKKPITFSGETDRIYFGSGPVEIVDGARRIEVSTDGASNIVIWNPGAKRAKDFADIEGSQWRRFVCIEGANVLDDTLRLKSGKTHTLKYTVDISK